MKTLSIMLSFIFLLSVMPSAIARDANRDTLRQEWNAQQAEWRKQVEAEKARAEKAEAAAAAKAKAEAERKTPW